MISATIRSIGERTVTGLAVLLQSSDLKQALRPPKRDYYCQSRRDNRLFELGFSEVGLALGVASSKTDQACIAAIYAEYAEHGRDGFLAGWLRARGVGWAAELIPDLTNLAPEEEHRRITEPSGLEAADTDASTTGTTGAAATVDPEAQSDAAKIGLPSTADPDAEPAGNESEAASIPANAGPETVDHVDKRGSHRAEGVIQAAICDGDQLGPRPDVERGMGVF